LDFGKCDHSGTIIGELEAAMKRILRLCLYIMILGSTLLGCQQGVTDIGNPNVTQKPPQASPSSPAPASPANPSAPSVAPPAPRLSQLIGAYTNISSGKGMCAIDATQLPSITTTSDLTQIILNNFLDYSVGTQNILATYDSKMGSIAFDLSSLSLEITTCTGQANIGSQGVVVNLQCKLALGSDSDCQVTFEKK
jgi:hypothetical protein